MEARSSTFDLNTAPQQISQEALERIEARKAQAAAQQANATAQQQSQPQQYASSPQEYVYTAADQEARQEEFKAEDEARGKSQEATQGTQPEQEKTFEFHPLSDVSEMKPPQWIVKPVIIEGGVGQIWGQSGSSKSFLAIDLGMHVAHGWSWYGHRVKQRPVRYMVLEGGQGFAALRLRAYMQWHYSRGGNILNGDFQYFVGNFDLMEESEVISLAKSIPEGTLLFIDTQAQATAGVEENTSGLGVAISNAQLLSRVAKCTVILIHHAGKDIKKGGRGWSGQKAAWDFEISVNKVEKGRYSWKVEKCKDGPDGEENDYRLEVLNLTNMDGSNETDDDGDPVTSCVAVRIEGQRSKKQRGKLTSGQRYGLDTLKEALEKSEDKSVHLDVWREIFYAGHTADTQSGKRGAFNRARQQLVELKEIYVSDDQYSIEKPDDNDSVSSVAERCKGVSCNADRSDDSVASVTHPYKGCNLKRSLTRDDSLPAEQEKAKQDAALAESDVPPSLPESDERDKERDKSVTKKSCNADKGDDDRPDWAR